MNPAYILVATILLPAIGAGLIWAASGAGRTTARRIALGTSLVTVVLAGWLVCEYKGGTEEFAGVTWKWIGHDDVSAQNVGADIRVQLSLGLDGLSVWMFGLSALLTVTAILVSWEAITESAPGFYALLLLLATGMLGVFAARDILLFYVFFEFTLIPLFFLIGIWGSEERRYAAVKFFLFTLAGSLLAFLGLLAIVLWVWNHSQPSVLTFSIAELTEQLQQHPINAQVSLGCCTVSLQTLIFIALFAGFAIKVPLFPLHTWLPLAHVQAPTAGSVILAGILLKIGTYGFLRFSLPMLPDATAACLPWVLWLSVAGIIYGALVALAQKDIKRLIAYSSVSHLGFCMLGIFALTKLGLEGGVLQMINHGLSTGGLFALVGMLYERYHTREISSYSGLAKKLPLLTVMFVIFTMSSIGLPGLNGFVGEFWILIGMFQRAFHDGPDALAGQLKIISVVAVLGVVLGAWYMLYLVQRVFFGPLQEPGDHGHDQSAADHPPVRDLNLREVAALAPLVVLMFWIGLRPETFRKPMSESIAAVSEAASQALQPTVPKSETQPAE